MHKNRTSQNRHCLRVCSWRLRDKGAIDLLTRAVSRTAAPTRTLAEEHQPRFIWFSNDNPVMAGIVNLESDRPSMPKTEALP